MVRQMMKGVRDLFAIRAAATFATKLFTFAESLPRLGSFDELFDILHGGGGFLTCLSGTVEAFELFIRMMEREYPDYIAGTSQLFYAPIKSNIMMFTHGHYSDDYIDGFPNGKEENRHKHRAFGPFTDYEHVGVRAGPDHYGGQDYPGRRLQVNGLHRVPELQTSNIPHWGLRSAEVDIPILDIDVGSTNPCHSFGRDFSLPSILYGEETDDSDVPASAGTVCSRPATASPDNSWATSESYAETTSTATDVSTYQNPCVIICHDDTSDEDEESYDASYEESYEESYGERRENPNICRIIDNDGDSSIHLKEDMPHGGHRQHIPDTCLKSSIGTTTPDTDLCSDSDSNVGSSRTPESFKSGSPGSSAPPRLQPNDRPFRYKDSRPPSSGGRVVTRSGKGSESDMSDTDDSAFECSDLGSATLAYFQSQGAELRDIN